MLTPKQRSQYLRTQIQTASPEQLILMLYDGVIRFCRKALMGMEKRDYESIHLSLTRAQEIILELNCCLDREQGGEIAENLARLYAYALQRLMEANMERDAEKTQEVITIFEPLREGWSGAMDTVRQNAPAEENAARPDAAAARPAPMDPAPQFQSKGPATSYGAAGKTSPLGPGGKGARPRSFAQPAPAHSRRSAEA